MFTEISNLIRAGRYDDVVELIKKIIAEHRDQLPTSQRDTTTNILRQLGEKLIAESKIEAHPNIKHAPWRIICFDKLKFLQPGKEIQDIHWKRKKAEELFTYLLIQPNYAAPKDATAELLFAHKDADQMANQLYVAIHQIKRTLHHYLGISNGITIKNGMIQLNEDMIDHVDVEKYNTLIRVGNQLWPTHPDLSSELFDEAQQMYGVLMPTLHYIDWLDHYREHLLKKQTDILKRLGAYASAIHELERAELYYLEWIRLTPFEEEAYQMLIKLLIQMERASVAKQWYLKMEHLFRTELGITPMEETRKIVTEGIQ